MSREKQIDEMAKIIDDNHGFIVSSVETAQALYNAGYRKQSVGEWIRVAAYNDGVLNTAKCSVCKTLQPAGLWDYHPYCPFCGARMKGARNDNTR